MRRRIKVADPRIFLISVAYNFFKCIYMYARKWSNNKIIIHVGSQRPPAK